MPEDDEHNVKAWHENKSARYTGAGTFAVTLSPDGETLYAVNSGSNSVAVIRIQDDLHGRRIGHEADAYRVVGLIPTAYEPHDVTLSADGTWFYIVNGKSVTGPNPGHLSGSTGSLTEVTYPGGNAAANAAAKASNQYQFQLERASLVAAPVPARGDLNALTAQVADNNFYKSKPRPSLEKILCSQRVHTVPSQRRAVPAASGTAAVTAESAVFAQYLSQRRAAPSRQRNRGGQLKKYVFTQYLRSAEPCDAFAAPSRATRTAESCREGHVANHQTRLRMG